MPDEGSAQASGEVHLGFVAGIMTRERIIPFEKVSMKTRGLSHKTFWCKFTYSFL